MINNQIGHQSSVFCHHYSNIIIGWTSLIMHSRDINDRQSRDINQGKAVASIKVLTSIIKVATSIIKVATSIINRHVLSGTLQCSKSVYMGHSTYMFTHGPQ